jgi:hypothetical protein
LLANPNPIILAYEEGYTSVQAVVASTTKTKTQNMVKKKNSFFGTYFDQIEFPWILDLPPPDCFNNNFTITRKFFSPLSPRNQFNIE